MADSYEFLKGHYDRIQSEQRARDKECGEDHIVGERPDDCFSCLSEQRDSLLTALRDLCDAIPDETIAEDPPLGCWVDAARAAIAKANGCPTCGADLRGSFPKCSACQLVDALKDGQ